MDFIKEKKIVALRTIVDGNYSAWKLLKYSQTYKFIQYLSHCFLMLK